MNYKEQLHKIFHELFEVQKVDEKKIGEYFSPDYVQYADGEQLDYVSFLRHVLLVNEKIESCKVTFKTLICEGDIVYSNHYVDAIMKSGVKARHHVLAEFHFKDGKIIMCDELSHLEKGDVADANLASIN